MLLLFVVVPTCYKVNITLNEVYKTSVKMVDYDLDLKLGDGKGCNVRLCNVAGFVADSNKLGPGQGAFYVLGAIDSIFLNGFLEHWL